MRTRMLVGALVFSLAAATVFAVWPVVGDAPWLDDKASPRLGEALYSAGEAVGRVRGALEMEGECTEQAYHERWAAFHVANSRCWIVAGLCMEEAGPLVVDPPPYQDVAKSNARWQICEDDGVVIPLTDLAAEFMRPRYQ